MAADSGWNSALGVFRAHGGSYGRHGIRVIRDRSVGLESRAHQGKVKKKKGSSAYVCQVLSSVNYDSPLDAPLRLNSLGAGGAD